MVPAAYYIQYEVSGVMATTGNITASEWRVFICIQVKLNHLSLKLQYSFIETAVDGEILPRDKFYVHRENVHYVFMPVSFASAPVQSELK